MLFWVTTGGMIIDLIVLAFIIVISMRGYFKGITSIIFGFLCTIVAVLITFTIYKPVASWVVENTGVDEYFSDGIYRILEDKNFKDTGLLDEENSGMSKQLVEIINKYFSEALNKAEANVFNYVSIKLASLMVNLLTFIVLIIIIRIILGFLKFIVDILAKLPILKTINRSGGFLVGLIKSLFIVYIVFAMFSMFSPMLSNTPIFSMIQDSKISLILYNNNFILNWILK